MSKINHSEHEYILVHEVDCVGNLLTPWIEVLLEKLVFAQLVKRSETFWPTFFILKKKIRVGLCDYNSAFVPVNSPLSISECLTNLYETWYVFHGT